MTIDTTTLDRLEHELQLERIRIMDSLSPAQYQQACRGFDKPEPVYADYVAKFVAAAIRQDRDK